MTSAAATFPAPFDEFDLPPLPALPGGWAVETFRAGARDLRLLKPATPDVLLDDPDVIRAHQKNGYMPYWGYVWPSSYTMIRALERAPWKRSARVLELGAGTGIVGLAMQEAGDVVTYSDYDPTSCLLCRYNALANGFSADNVLQLDWNAPASETFPVIVGCEVTYERGNHPLLLKVLDRMLTPDGVCWLGEPGRYWSRFFFDDARQQFRVRVLNERLEEIDVPRSDAFQIFELKKLTTEN